MPDIRYSGCDRPTGISAVPCASLWIMSLGIWRCRKGMAWSYILESACAFLDVKVMAISGALRMGSSRLSCLELAHLSQNPLIFVCCSTWCSMCCGT